MTVSLVKRKLNHVCFSPPTPRLISYTRKQPSYNSLLLKPGPHKHQLAAKRGGVYEIERSLSYRPLTREDHLSDKLPASLSGTLTNTTTDFRLDLISLLSTISGPNGTFAKKKKKCVERQHQSIAQPHQSDKFALERTAFHIKAIHPCLIPVAAMGKCK